MRGSMKQILMATLLFLCFGLFAQAAPVPAKEQQAGDQLDVAAAMKLLGRSLTQWKVKSRPAWI